MAGGQALATAPPLVCMESSEFLWRGGETLYRDLRHDVKLRTSAVVPPRLAGCEPEIILLSERKLAICGAHNNAGGTGILPALALTDGPWNRTVS